MKVISGNYSIARYCEELAARRIIVNRDYQRSDKVWPPSANSYLIESILLGFPLPKFLLRQKTDLKSRITTLEIVDGQQRTSSICSFFSNKFTITSGRFRGYRFDGLPEDLQSAFISYQLSTDTFADATDAEIRETYRRINAYTAPLSKQEQRHSRFQGVFKVFVADLSAKYSDVLRSLNVFGERQLVRMNDAELFTEVIRAMFFGIETWSAAKLDATYSMFDDSFEQSEFVEKSFDLAFSTLLALDLPPGPPLFTRYNMYSILLALINGVSVWDPLRAEYPMQMAGILPVDMIRSKFLALSDALSVRSNEPQWAEFVRAASEGTNTVTNRKARFGFLCRLLTGPAG